MTANLRAKKRWRLPASLAVQRGTRFLLSKQSHDGLWRDFLTPAGEASEWPTGFIAAALHRAGADPSALGRAADTLIAKQRVNGGWAYNENVPSDADSTACVLLFLELQSQRSNRSDRAASFLDKHQQKKSGGFATYCDPGPIRKFMGVSRWMRFDGWCSPHTEVTAMAGRALSAVALNTFGLQANAAWQYVRSRQHANGSWKSYWWTSPHYTTLQAVELAQLLGDHEPVRRAAEWAIRGQAGDGAWNGPGASPSAFATALSLSILLNVPTEYPAIERAILKLVALQDEDGGWPTHPIMRIPLPGDLDPDKRRFWPFSRFGGGIVVQDQHRTFTSASCVDALARALEGIG